jgi:hypothetical protein
MLDMLERTTNEKQTTKNIALAACFTALYVILSFIPLSQIIGWMGKTITAATILAPIIGIIIGPYHGLLSSFSGGILALLFNLSFSLPSLVAGGVASLFGGWLSNGERGLCIFTYFSLLFFFGFYPFVGPVWLYPPLMWFQIIGFLILISPLQSKALRNLRSKNNANLTATFFLLLLVSTLAGQIAGSLAFEVISWPVFIADITAWKAAWQLLTYIYPAERLIIALSATFLCVPIHKVLQNANLLKKKTNNRLL